MLPKRVMDLTGWPPQPGGTLGRGEVIPMSTEEVTVEKVIRTVGVDVNFTCRFQGRSVSYDLFTPDERTAAQVAAILNENVGKVLFEVGFVELPSDDN